MMFLRRIVCVANAARMQSTQAAPQAPKAPQAPGTGPVIKGQIANKIPKYVELEPGKKYHWCACGLSKKQPMCDGSHKSMPEPKISPVHFEVAQKKKYFLCRCKQTSNRPFCDLTHVKTFIPASIREKLGIKL